MYNYIIELISRITELSKNYSCRAYIKTINSIIKGTESGMFVDLFRDQPYFGLNTMSTCDSLQVYLNKLIQHNLLDISSAGIYSLTEKADIYLDRSIRSKRSEVAFGFQNEIIDKINLVMFNRENSMIFDENDIENLADWTKRHSSKSEPIPFHLHDNNVIFCDSSEEIEVLNMLVTNRYTREIRGQSLEIIYESQRMEGKKYFPDIVALTYDFKIAIIEVKPLLAMSNHLNIAKYIALQKYCVLHDYQCCMIDKKLQSINVFLTRIVPDYIKTQFYNILDEKGEFSNNDLPSINKEYRSKADLILDIHAIIIQDGLKNSFTNGLMVTRFY